MTVGPRQRLRALVVCCLSLVPALAAADSFGGFSGVDRPYLVNQDRVCTPLKVVGGAATGAPTCEKAGADVIARLSIKDPLPQRGAKATFAATAQGKTLTITRAGGEGGAPKGAVILVWTTLDPITKVVEVFGSQYDDRVAVAYSTRKMGRETTEIVAFDLLGARPAPAASDPATQPATTAPPAADPKVTKAIAEARGQKSPPKAIAAWKKVLVLEPGHPEAMYRIAAMNVATKQTADALVQLETLASSKRADAIEWLVEARYDAAFAAVRTDQRFRTAVGAGRKPVSLYERLMGFGGQWEQTGTSCDKPDVKLVLKRERTFALRVKTTCQGSVYDTPFKGAWRLDPDKVVLMLPNAGKVTAADEMLCVFEPAQDEDALRCVLGRDLDFVVLPARR